MEITGIASSVASSPLSSSASSSRGPGDSFKEALGSAVEELNRLQRNADEVVNRLAAGETVDLHSVTIAVEEASVAFQLAMQVRNKLVEAYQEVMRMQV